MAFLKKADDTPRHDERPFDVEEEFADFAYSVSHDMNAPVRHMVQLSDLLIETLGEKVSSEEEDLVRLIGQAGKTLNGMLEGLLAFSKVSTQANPFAPVDCAGLISDISREIAPRLTDLGAVLRAGPMPVLDGDRAQLSFLFRELIGNAIRFRREEAPLEIGIEAHLSDGFWTIRIRDTGRGVAQAMRARIFSFFEADGPGGTGMGLAICRSIVRRHGGSIWCEPHAGPGACFCVRLPARQDHANTCS